MYKKLAIRVALLGLPVFMGISMPSCPGQEEMQAKIDAGTQEVAQMKAKLQAQAQDLTAMKDDYVNTKKIVNDMGTVVLGQKQIVEALQADVKMLADQVSQLKMARGGGAKKPLPPKKK